MRWFLAVAIATLLPCAPTWASPGVDGPSTVPAIGQESPPAGEDAAICDLTAFQKMGMEAKESNPGFKGKRGQHPKTQGGVVATFQVAEGLPDDLKYGIFREPKAYRAILRYSNGSSLDDTKPDVHGWAIKLIGVSGARASAADDERATQDFVMIDSPFFFARDVATTLAIARAQAAARATPPSLDQLKQIDKDHHQELVLAGQATTRVLANPLRVVYWSTTPYKLGAGAVKYSAVPRDREPTLPAGSPAPGKSKDYLREAMVARLARGREPVVFDFVVNRQADPAVEPIEDPTVEWKTPPVKLATITIEPQTFDSPEQLAFTEALSFTPWHALADHRPLGGINRARNPIYRMSSTFRHDSLKAAGKSPSAPFEPTAADLDTYAHPAP